MKTIIALTLAALTLTACQPTNLNDCLTEAAQAPTDQGVRIATAACFNKFQPQN